MEKNLQLLSATIKIILKIQKNQLKLRKCTKYFQLLMNKILNINYLKCSFLFKMFEIASALTAKETEAATGDVL